MNKSDFKHIHTRFIKFPHMTFLYFSKLNDNFYIIIDNKEETKFYSLSNDFTTSMDIFVSVWYQLKFEHQISEKTYSLLHAV
jgi:hypothetical protein